MHLLKRQHGRVALAAVAAGALAVTAACSGSDDGDGGDGGTTEDGKIQLTVSVFGTFGYTEAGLEAEYEALHDNIDVVIEGDGVNFDQEFRPTLETNLETGSGAGDVVGIDEQGVVQLFSNPDHWYDLGADYSDRSADYVEWKWDLGHTPDGKLVGFGTDVGGMGMCYRSDIFAEAGLPTDREEVAAAWADWDGFKAVAQQFVDSGVDAAFLDGPTQLQNMLLGQLAGTGDGQMYVDADGNLTLDSAAAQTSVNTILQLEEMGAIGNFVSWSEEWMAGMAEGGYAVMPCPGWMAGGVIAQNSGEENAGKWDMAAAPGVAGNWGGSWLAVPAQSEHPEEAAELAAWLTAPEQQIKVFEAVGNFPSSPEAQADPKVADSTNEYFSGAPVGQIIGASVQSFPPLEYSYYHPPVKNAVEGVLNGVVDGTFQPDEAWPQIESAAEEAIQLAGSGL
ncbi:extracellular solute-binding protein [Glycomyces sp. TRM65418]|uniref:ABC transporter substrate-binding protein n=1 Tax=Glycomyces sp. TRM65418 TaxID=2867006 RepID=UPI001CE62263|nr:extracellular solute-binding protein [Glycomyces sp. TRM65418]MCC3764626.1 extracellular solute-binding protein [Glycomyces sp. TRM65418]QZD54290.1 extracellular solute-binding protein [Glycomyces sp. TRM65418]